MLMEQKSNKLILRNNIHSGVLICILFGLICVVLGLWLISLAWQSAIFTCNRDTARMISCATEFISITLISLACIGCGIGSIWVVVFDVVANSIFDTSLRKVTIKWLFPLTCIEQKLEEIDEIIIEEELDTEVDFDRTVYRVSLVLASSKHIPLMDFDTDERAVQEIAEKLQEFLESA